MEVESDDSAPLWLVKLPGFLYSFLSDRAQQGKGDVVGVLAEGGEGKDKTLRFELAPELAPELEGKPTAFLVKPRPLDQQLKCFSSSSNGQLEVLGSVAFKGDMLPTQEGTYSEMMKGKLKKAETKTASTIVQSATTRSVAEKKQLYKRGRDELKANRAAAPRQEIVLTKDEMVTEMLDLFRQKPYWMKSEIVSHTRQADKMVTEVLKELALVVPSGEYKNFYHLKDEFQINSAPKKAKK